MRTYAVLVLAVLALSTAAMADVINGGFETGDLTGWATGGTGVNFTVTNSNPHSGTYAVQCAGVDGTFSVLDQTVSVQPNTKYTVAVWYRTSGTPAAIDSHVDEQKADGSYAGASHSLSIPAASSPGWALYSVTFETSPNTYQLYLYNGMNLAAGVDVFFDDFSVTVVPLVSNGGFELGDLTGWSPGGAGVNFNVVTDNPHSGTYDLACVGVNGSVLSQITESIDVKPSTQYYASVWVRTQGVPIAFDCHFDEYTSGGTYAGKSDSLFGGTWGSPLANWTRLSVMFTTSPTTTNVIWYSRMNVPSGVTIFLDDFKLVEIPPQTGPIVNPGFELGDVIGWNTGGTGVNFDVTTTNPHSGNYAADITGLNGSFSVLSQTIKVQPSTDYLASMWFRSSGAWTANAWDSHLDEQKSDGSYAGVSHSLGVPATLVDNWTRYTALFQTTANTTQVYWYNGMNIANGDQAFLDDFSITPVTFANMSVGGVRQGGALTFATVDGAVVTRDFEDYLGTESHQYFFVEAPDRSAGMFVDTSAYPMPTAPQEGDVVHLKGYFNTASSSTATADFAGMLTFQTVETPTITTSPGTPLKPLVTTLKPILDTTGLSMQGLLVQVEGKVSGADEGSGTFYIDDGSGQAVRVYSSFAYPFPSNDQTVSVIGNVASFTDIPYIYVLHFEPVNILAP